METANRVTRLRVKGQLVTSRHAVQTQSSSQICLFAYQLMTLPYIECVYPGVYRYEVCSTRVSLEASSAMAVATTALSFEIR